MKSITMAAAAALIVASTAAGFAQGMAPAKDPVQGSGSAADAQKLGDKKGAGATMNNNMGSGTTGMSADKPGAPSDPVQGSGDPKDARNLNKSTPSK